MSQLELFEVPSPCVGVCQSGEGGYCLGCFRSRDERFDWLYMTTEQKQKVIKLCSARKQRARQKQNKQAETTSSNLDLFDSK